MTFKKKHLIIAKMIGMIIIPIILLLLPASFFDTGRSICLSVLLLDMECYACGMTRGIMHLIHLDFHTAWEYNKLSYIVFPILSWVYAKEFLDTLQEYKRQQNKIL